MYTTIADQLHAEGRAEGRAAALLDILRYRALPVSDSVRERIMATRDERKLEHWFRRALMVSAADEVFETGAAEA